MRYYLSIGWSLIPIKNDKRPMVDWQKYQAERMTEKELEGYIVNKGAGLALVCGKLSNVTVLDDDGLKKQGFASELVKNINSPIVCQTPSGGFHYYFLGNEKIKNTVNIAGKAVDIRGEGGYVGIPNSPVMLKTGELGFYKWIKPPKKENLAELQDLMTANEIQSALKESKVGKSLDYKQILELTSGSRNSSLLKFARSLFTRHEEADVINLVTAVNNGYNPPLPADEVKTILNQAKKYHEEQTGKRIKQPRSIKEVSEQRAIEFDMIAKAPSTGMMKLDSLVGGFTPGNLYTMTGETNAGKTSLACNFAVNVAKQGKKVLYIALESGTGIVQILASIIKNKPYKEVTKQILSNFEIPNIDLFIDDDIKSVEELEKIIRETTVHYDLIVVDHIGYFVHDKANYLQDQANILKQLRALTKQKNTAIMLIAHLRKRVTGKKEDIRPTADDIAGSAAFKQDSTDVFIIIREKDEFDLHNIAVTEKGYLYVVKTKGISTGVVELKFNDVNVVTKSALITEVTQSAPTAQLAVSVQSRADWK